MLEALQKTQPTYGDIGATLAGREQEGFRHESYEVVVGNGREAFLLAVQGLKTWEAHRLPGIRVFPTDQDITMGATVVVTVGTPRVALAAPCRIVSVIDQPDRWGFAYGTLPGHPEQGEEAFVVSLLPDENVSFEIVAFSRPGGLLVRFSGPIGRGVQRRGTCGYLRALKRFVDQSREGG